MNISRHATIRLFQPTGARKRMTPNITPCSIYGDIRILALSGAIAFISTVSIFLMSVVQRHPAGLSASIFHAEYNLHSKFILSKLINTTVRGILWHSRKKISTAPGGR